MNCKSDFTLIERGHKLDFHIPFKFTYYTHNNKYLVCFDGNEYTKCKPLDNGDLLVIFDKHGLEPGKLKVHREFSLNNDDYENGKCDIVSNEELDFSLDNKSSEYDNNVIIDVYPYYQKGDKGDSAFEEWIKTGHDGTEEDFLNWIQKPSVDAANLANKSRLNIEKNETIRSNNESTRNNEEVARVLAEKKRVEAEAERQKGYEDIKNHVTVEDFNIKNI